MSAGHGDPGGYSIEECPYCGTHSGNPDTHRTCQLAYRRAMARAIEIAHDTESDALGDYGYEANCTCGSRIAEKIRTEGLPEKKHGK